jgi:hypothetical protein
MAEATAGGVVDGRSRPHIACVTRCGDAPTMLRASDRLEVFSWIALIWK